MMKKRSKRLIYLAVALFLVVFAGPAGAIDNPDAPDRMGPFTERADQLEADMLGAPSNAAFVAAAGHYHAFLDEQLNRAFALLKGHLAAAEAADLTRSQRRWLRFRDQEQVFIDGNWTPESFGSSYVLSRHHYRSSLTRARIEQLLQYLRNYPDAGATHELSRAPLPATTVARHKESPVR